jgi:biopolymer transport protein TolR
MIDLPSVGKAAKQPDRVIQVIIGTDESIKLKVNASPDEKLVRKIDQLAGSIQQAIQGNANAAVVISADKNVKYEAVVRVMDTLQRAGVSRVGLSVQLAP